jgi:hypothetical protein
VAVVLLANLCLSINQATPWDQTQSPGHNQITQALAAFADAQKRGDAETALKKAEDADRLARQTLAPTDLLRAEAIRALGRLRCAAALDKKLHRAALGVVEEVRDAAAAAGDLPTALDWAKYAVTLAPLIKETDGGSKALALASLSLARLELAQLANDPARVREKAREVVRCAEQVLARGDSSRLSDLFILAVLEHRAGNIDEAFRLYEQIAAEGKPHTRRNAQFVVIAEINCAGRLIGRAGGGESAAVARLVEAATATLELPPAQASGTDLLTLIDERFWGPSVQQAKSQPDILAREAWLRAFTGQAQSSLREAKAPAAWALQGSLRVARLHSSFSASMPLKRPSRRSSPHCRA